MSSGKWRPFCLSLNVLSVSENIDSVITRHNQLIKIPNNILPYFPLLTTMKLQKNIKFFSTNNIS